MNNFSNLFTILVTGLLGVGGLGLGIVNMSSINKVNDTLQAITQQGTIEEGISLEEDSMLEDVKSITNTTGPSTATAAQPSAPAPTMSQSLATQLVTSTWQIPMNPQEGPSPTITYTPGANGMYGIVVLRPLLDDSTSTYRYEGVAMYTGPVDGWYLTPHTLTWKCHVNRGHQDFSTVPCN